MTAHSLIARQLPCNEKNGGIYTKKSNDRPQNIKARAAIDKISNVHTSTKYLSFYSAQKIIHNLLSYNRIVLLPTVIPRFTELELAKKLNVTTRQLRCFQKSPDFYKGIAKHICLPLAKLYCSSALQQPKSLHIPEGVL